MSHMVDKLPMFYLDSVEISLICSLGACVFKILFHFLGFNLAYSNFC